MENISQNIVAFNETHSTEDKAICTLLTTEITRYLPEAENKIWHGHPVWFLDGNPIVGYSKQKAGIRLMFWSGADLEEAQLNVRGAKFKDASIFYNSAEEIHTQDLKRWLRKSKEIQWDYRSEERRVG